MVGAVLFGLLNNDMRQLFLIFALSFCGTLSGQSEAEKTVVFTSDTPEKDSFYVKQTTFVPANGRIDTLKDYTFFRDTNTLKNYRDNVHQQLEGLRQRIMFLKLEYDSLRSRALELDTLVEDIINFVRSETTSLFYESIEQPPAIFQLEFACYLTSTKKRRRKKGK